MDNSIYLSLFAGKNILIVEDEYFLADETRQQLEQLGATVVGPAANVEDALELIALSKIDGAILDIHLGDQFVFPVAEELAQADVPFVFATGYDPAMIPARFSGFALCGKPTELGRIAVALFGPDGGAAFN